MGSVLASYSPLFSAFREEAFKLGMMSLLRLNHVWYVVFIEIQGFFPALNFLITAFISMNSFSDKMCILYLHC